MVWQLQNTSNYGTRTPAIARTVIQGKEIVQFLDGTKEQDAEALSLIFDLQRKLIRCVSIYDEIQRAVVQADDDLRSGKIKFAPTDQVVRPPSIPDLDAHTASFLQGTRLAIGAATRIIEPYYGQSFGHRLNRFATWAAKSFGTKHPYWDFAQQWQPWVKQILAMRDAIDHPGKGPRARLHIRNFHVEFLPDKATLFPPQWWLDGEPAMFIGDSMAHIIEGIIQLHEHLLAAMLEVRKKFPVALEEIPAAKRDPACPVRFRVGLAIPNKNVGQT